MLRKILNPPKQKVPQTKFAGLFLMSSNRDLSDFVAFIFQDSI